MKKFLCTVFCATFAAGLAAGLSACGGSGGNLGGSGDDDFEYKPIVVTNVSQLAQNYSAETKNFLSSEVLEKAISYSIEDYNAQNLLAATYELGYGSEKVLSSVKVVFTYKNGEERIFGVNEVEFEEALSLKQIAEYTKNAQSLAAAAESATVESIYCEQYNYIENEQYADLSAAIYEKVVGATDQPERLTLIFISNLAYPVEGGTYPYNCTEYDLLVKTQNSITRHNIILKRQDNPSDYIESLNSEKNYKLYETTPLVDFATPIVEKEYQSEDIDVPPLIENIENLGELKEKYPEELTNFLNAQTDAAINMVVSDYAQSDLKAVRWILGADSITQISEAYIEFTLKGADGYETYYRAKVEYYEDIELKAIAADYAAQAQAIGTARARTTKEFTYSAKERYFRQSLTDALTAKLNIAADAQVMIDFGEDNYGTTQITVNCATEQGYFEYILQVATGESELDLIAAVNGTDLESALTHESSQQNANAFTFIEYTADTFVIDDISTALQYYSDQIAVNLQPVYEFVKTNIISEYYRTKSYTWDLGEVIDGTISVLKMSAYMKNSQTGSDIYTVYEITLPTPLTVNDLLNKSAIENISFGGLGEDIYNLYQYSYNESQQSSSNDEFVTAVCDRLDPDFDYTGAKLIYQDNGVATHPTYGQCRMFCVVLINEKGVREFNISTPLPNGENTLLGYVTTGRFSIDSTKSVDYSLNQIEVAANEV